MVTNPLAAYKGQPFEAVEEPIDLYEEFKEENWFRRILRRK